MTSRPPPPRYRVVERGRRLEVIDTATGEAAGGPPATDPDRRWPTLPERQGFDGRALLVTHRWYDAKAPRRLQLDPGTVQVLGWARGVAIVVAMTTVLVAIAAPAVLALFLLPLVLLGRSVRTAVRAGVTAWLDRLDPA